MAQQHQMHAHEHEHTLSCLTESLNFLWPKTALPSKLYPSISKCTLVFSSVLQYTPNLSYSATMYPRLPLCTSLYPGFTQCFQCTLRYPSVPQCAPLVRLLSLTSSDPYPPLLLGCNLNLTSALLVASSPSGVSVQ